MGRFGIAGAGISGAVIARQLADAGFGVHVYERRDHVAGNCHTDRDETGVMRHRYGPHIFHTGNVDVWEFVNRFADMVPYRHRVKAVAADGHVYSLPINLHTINQAFGTAFGPCEARSFMQSIVEPIAEPANFEQAALASVGRRLYELFFEGYTLKQWGIHPSELPVDVFRRLPIRFNYDDGYFNHPWQAIPRHGYTAMIEQMLDHPHIHVHLGTEYPHGDHRHTIWTGPLDAFFEHRYGRLSYRTLDFVDVHADGDVTGAPIVNYTAQDTPWTRTTEHKHFAPWEVHHRSTVTYESSRLAGPDDDPFYPIRLADDLDILDEYRRRARQRTDVTFVGRLATYRYLDMDVSVAEALDAADAIRRHTFDGGFIPAFTHKEN